MFLAITTFPSTKPNLKGDNMKIKYKNGPTIVKFCSLEQGDVYRSVDDETIFMKIAEIPQTVTDYNCISLADGEPTFFADFDNVVLLNATLVIE